MTSVRELPQTLPAAALHAGCDHYVLHADECGASRKHGFVADDMIEAHSIVEGSLRGKEGETVVSVAQVLHGKAGCIVVRHDSRFGQVDAHPGCSLGASYAPFDAGHCGNISEAASNKDVANPLFSQPHDNHSSFVSRHGERAVNATKDTPHSATVAS